MSGDTTAEMSEICATSSSAATRGMKFLPKVVAGREHVAVALGERHDQRGEIFRDRVLVGRMLGEQHLGDARDLGARLGDGTAIRARDQEVDVAADRGGGGDGVERRAL